MMKNKVIRIFILLLIVSLIIMKVFNVGVAANSINEILNGGNAIPQDPNSTVGTETNTPTTTNTPNTSTTGTNSNNKANTALPKTGTNENIVIGLMIVCTVVGVYAFKKVKDYNMN